MGNTIHPDVAPNMTLVTRKDPAFRPLELW